jgi:galactokinase
MNKLTTSAPGRICLFGEHQDYLSLPVIAMAINLRLSIRGTARNDKTFKFDMPDINSKDEFSYSTDIKYVLERDYFRSGVNILLREGLKFPSGYDCFIHGTIPINSGTASSSSLCVAWIKFLLTIANDPRSNEPIDIARLAHKSEVLEFGEPGGMMDQFTAGVGSLVFIDFSKEAPVHNHPMPVFEQLTARLGTFVLGDSKEPKDTKGILSRVKGGIFRALDTVRKDNQDLTMKSVQFDDAKKLEGELKELLKGSIMSRELAVKARELLSKDAVDDAVLGKLLNEHQRILRDYLKISTPKINRMLDAGLKAGALGGKINGSGGGGCMFVYAPKEPEKVAQAIEQAGGKAHIIKPDKGVALD